MAVGTYVVIGDLDRTYTTKTHPTLIQVTKYLLEANILLTNWLKSTTISDTHSGLKDVGIELTENKIYNRKVKDHIEGYQFYKTNGLTMNMKDRILSVKPWSESFSFVPGSQY